MPGAETTPGTSGAGTVMVHQAAFTWKDDAPEGQGRAVAEALVALLPQLDGVVSLTFGENLGLTDSAADFGVCGVFRDEAAYRAYAGHPDHVHILHDLVLPHAAARTVVQYRPAAR